ncbi:MAG: hypothetical protein QM270_00665 [Bacillota bacterium]|nr:hypothetical protein [Bacillota bacterium]
MILALSSCGRNDKIEDSTARPSRTAAETTVEATVETSGETEESLKASEEAAETTSSERYWDEAIILGEDSHIYQYFMGFVEEDEEKAVSNMWPVKGEGAVPVDYLKTVKAYLARNPSLMQNLQTLLRDDVRNIVIEDLGNSMFNIHYYDTDGDITANMKPLTSLMRETLNVNGEGRPRPLGMDNFEFEIPAAFADVYLNGRKVEFESINKARKGVSKVVIEKLPMGRYEVSFGASYLKLEPFTFELKAGYEIDPWYGQAGARDVQLNDDALEAGIEMANTLLDEAFSSAEDGPIDATVFTSIEDDKIKSDAANSFNLGLRNMHLVGAKSFQKIRTSSDTDVNAIDRENFLVEFEFEYQSYHEKPGTGGTGGIWNGLRGDIILDISCEIQSDGTVEYVLNGVTFED